MSKSVRIEQFSQDIVVEDGDTILQAALDAGLDYPFMCQQGQCGACKAQLISGTVELGTYYNPMILTEEDRASGQILACQAEPLSDCVISIGVIDGEISHVLRDLKFEVVSLSVASGIIVLRLRNISAEPFHFSAGQSARLSFDGFPAVDASMANRPDDEVLEFHLTYVADDLLSVFIAELVEGAGVRVEGPFGSAYLHDEHLGPILLAGYGAECGRLMSIVDTALKSGMAQQISFFSDMQATPRLLALEDRNQNFRYFPLQSMVALDEAAEVRFLTDAIGSTTEDLQAFNVYLAGSQSFCSSVKDALVERGLNPGHCYF